jgi:hypothetical protein
MKQLQLDVNYSDSTKRNEITGIQPFSFVTALSTTSGGQSTMDEVK